MSLCTNFNKNEKQEFSKACLAISETDLKEKRKLQRKTLSIKTNLIRLIDKPSLIFQ
jgi:flagellar basal body-associated protein FliL